MIFRKTNRPGSAELRKLSRRFRPGYRVVAAGHAKHAIEDPDGNLVRKEGSGLPFLLANSPHVRGRYVAQVEEDLRHLGVIE